MKFKSNIKCGACVAKVTNALNETAGENQWSVDLAHPDRILQINNPDVTPEQVQTALQATGYQAEKMEE